MFANNSVPGLFFGAALGFAGAFGGVGAFLFVLVLGVLGLAVGRWLDGQLDPSELADQLRGVGADRGRGRR